MLRRAGRAAARDRRRLGSPVAPAGSCVKSGQNGRPDHALVFIGLYCFFRPKEELVLPLCAPASARVRVLRLVFMGSLGPPAVTAVLGVWLLYDRAAGLGVRLLMYDRAAGLGVLLLL